MENDEPNYYNTEVEPCIKRERGRDDNEYDELNSFLQELIYPEPGCIDTLMNPNPNPNPSLGNPEEDGLAVELVQPKNGGDGVVHDQPSSMESSSSLVNEPISRSNLCDSPTTVVQAAARVMVMNNAGSLISFEDAGGDPMEKHHMTKPTRKKPDLWTNEEHTAFLHGLRDGFSGDWKNMSKKYVKGRSPTQIASHAQKYFKRQESGKPRRRKSINDITLSNMSTQRTEQATAAATKTKVSVSFTADQQPLPNSFYNISQSTSNSLPQPNPNPNPKWVVPVGTDPTQLPILPPRPIECNSTVDEARLYMARQLHDHESSSSSSSCIPHVSPLPAGQQMVPYSLNNPPEFHAYLSAQHMLRSRTIEHNPHQQPQTLASSWPLQQHDYRTSYDYYYNYPSSMPAMFNSIDLALQQSLSLDNNIAVNDTSQLTFNNVDMGPPPPLPDQDSKNRNFYP